MVKLMESVKTPKVSVCVVTYNHEKYIRQCLQSIVDQETDFDFEVIVGEDCSTDGTRAIVLEFADRYPGVVLPLFHAENIGAINNYCAVHLLACGEYVAHCDGDDYFLPFKLSEQALFLDSNPTCMMTAHRVKLLDGNDICSETQHNPKFIDIDYLLIKHPCFIYSSTMYRKANSFFINSIDRDVIDMFIYINFALKGPIGFIDKALGVYRRGVGISANLKLMNLISEALDFAEISLGPSKQQVINRARAKQYRSYGLNSLLRRDIVLFNNYIHQAYRFDPSSRLNNIIYQLRHTPLLLLICFSLFKNIKSIINRVKM